MLEMGCAFSAPKTTHDAGPRNGEAVDHAQEPPANPKVNLARNISRIAPEDLEDLAISSSKYRKGSIAASYRFKDVIAEGGFAQVIEIEHKRTKQSYACKVMKFPDTKKPDENDMSREDIFREVAISAGLVHKNIVCLVEFYFDKKKIFMVFELMNGGRLLEVVLKRPPEESTRMIFRQLIEGIAYLHSQDVTHRDLKLENILLEHKDDLSSIKIADFGLAKKSSRPLQTMCGTLYYVAPEVIKDDKEKFYTKSVDMWSAGVLLFVLLSARQPFASKNENQIFDKILSADFGFDKPPWQEVSTEAKDLVCKLLEIDSRRRLTAAEVLQHPFMKKE